jgi:NDP-sugar pyrophosphorylase family protein
VNVLVTMAGDGSRFEGSGYDTIKPLIEIEGRTILEWTTRSLPMIKHACPDEDQLNIVFAIREDHDKDHDLRKRLKEIYGRTRVHVFNKKTRGNLETAYISALSMFPDQLDELLILDADNNYDGSEVLNAINTHKKNNAPIMNFGVAHYFEPIDETPKWCFVKIGEDNKAISFHEKELVEGGYPMIGTFYYSSTSLFLNIARHILYFSEEVVEGEYFTSQSFKHMLKAGIPVYCSKVDKVCPLGTPEDVEKYKDALPKVEQWP